MKMNTKAVASAAHSKRSVVIYESEKWRAHKVNESLSSFAHFIIQLLGCLATKAYYGWALSGKSMIIHNHNKFDKIQIGWGGYFMCSCVCI